MPAVSKITRRGGHIPIIARTKLWWYSSPIAPLSILDKQIYQGAAQDTARGKDRTWASVSL